MATGRTLPLLLLTAGLVAGCASIRGTFVEPPEDGNRVYAGTRRDLQDIALDNCECDPIGAVAYLMLWPVYVIDLPLSAAADTLLLPYTLTLPRPPARTSEIERP
jgi:uncharacterized protein YceK